MEQHNLLIIERCADVLAWRKSPDGCYRAIMAAIATATRSYTAAIVERRWGLGKTPYCG